MAVDDSGPAFPLPATSYDGTNYQPEFGMSLRDWFAGQVLAATSVEYLDKSLSDIPEFKATDDETKVKQSAAVLAAGAYAIADAMIKERQIQR